jgi:U3 small nucleolar RNA-associated protein 22
MKRRVEITAQEISALKETESLFCNSIIKWNVENMLKESKFTFSQSKLIEDTFWKIKSTLDNISDDFEFTLQEGNVFLHDRNIVNPFPMPNNECYKIYFRKPASVHVAGSYLLKTTDKQKANADIVVEMPSEIFQEKDYVNNRYFYKRSFYISVLALYLKDFKPKLDFFLSDRRKPMLVVEIAGLISIRIIPRYSSTLFPFTLLNPRRNNLRKSCGDTNSSTPVYNNSVLSDSLFLDHLNYINVQNDNFNDAVKLVKIWLNQRIRVKSISGFVLSMIMAWLLRTNKLSGQWSCFQIFKVTLEFLANLKDHIFMNNEYDEMFTIFDVVVVDPSGTVNLTAHVTLSEWENLKNEARLTLRIGFSNFLEIFRKSEFFKFDNIFLLSPDTYLSLSSFDERLNHMILDCGSVNNALLLYLPNFLKKALGDRIKYVIAWEEMKEPSHISLSSEPEFPNIYVGFVLDPQNSNRRVDKGPSVNEKLEEALEFRRIWGEKSEVRRFQDGSIVSR